MAESDRTTETFGAKNATLFAIKPLDEAALLTATAGIGNAFSGTTSSFSNIIVGLTQSLNVHDAQMRALQQQYQKLAAERIEDKKLMARLEASLEEAKSQIKVLEYNLSGYDPDEVELPPSALPHHHAEKSDASKHDLDELQLPFSDGTSQAEANLGSMIPPTTSNTVDNDLCIYIGGFGLEETSEEVLIKLDCPEIGRISVITAKVSSFARLYFSNQENMDVAYRKIKELESVFTPRILPSLPESHSAILLSNIRVLYPLIASADELEDVMFASLEMYNVTRVSSRFGGTAKVFNVAVIECRESENIYQLLSDLESGNMVMEGLDATADVSVLKFELLEKEEQRELFEYKKKLRQKVTGGEISESFALISGFTSLATEEHIKRLIPFSPSIKIIRSGTGTSFRIAEASFLEPLLDEHLSAFANLTLQGDMITVEPISNLEAAPRRTIQVNSEKRRRMIQALLRHAKMLRIAQKLQFGSLTKQKVSDPKMTMMNRLQEMEGTMEKWFGKGGGGIFEQMQFDIIKAQQAINDQKDSISTIQDISDLEFSRAFDSRAEAMITEATGAATEDAVIRAVRLVADSGIIMEGSDGGWNVNDDLIKSILKPSLKAINDNITKQKDTFDALENSMSLSLSTKLDNRALRILVDMLEEGADLNKLLSDISDSVDVGNPENFYPYDRFEKISGGNNPMQKLRAPLIESLEAMEKVKADKDNVDANITFLKNEKQDKAMALRMKNDMDSEIANISERCAKFNDTIEMIHSSVNKVNRELGSDIPARFEVAESATNAVRKLLEDQVKISENLDSGIKLITGKLSEYPTEKQVRSMLIEFESLFSSSSNNDEKIDILVEELRRELQKKMSAEEVSRLIGTRLRDTQQQLDEDNTRADNTWTLKAGAIPATVAIGKLKYRVFRQGLHNYPTSTATHKRMSPVSATLAMPTSRQQQQRQQQQQQQQHEEEEEEVQLQQESLASMTSTNTISIATHSSGRGGALRSMMSRTPPLNPINGKNFLSNIPLDKQRPSTSSSVMNASRKGIQNGEVKW